MKIHSLSTDAYDMKAEGGGEVSGTFKVHCGPRVFRGLKQ